MIVPCGEPGDLGTRENCRLMMKKILGLLAIVGTFAACKTTRQAQTPVVVVPDTTTRVVIDKELLNSDSLSMQEVYRRVNANTITYNTFNSRARISFSQGNTNEDATAYIRMKSDSLVWISLRGPLGIEGFRIAVTPGQVVIIDHLKKTVMQRGIEYLSGITGFPFDFGTLQQMIVGNPIFTNGSITSYKGDKADQLEVLIKGRFLKHLIMLNNQNNTVVSSSLQDVNSSTNRSATITYTDYQQAFGFLFATNREINITNGAAIKVNLNFKSFTFDEPVSFPFVIPDDYKKI